MKPIEWTKNWADHNQIPYKFFETLKSSNQKAHHIFLKDQEILLILSRSQSHPYGRKSSPWVPSDFMATWTWIQKEPIYPVTSPRIGLLFYEAFQTVWPSINWSLKAPNDIFYKDKKLCGLLLETVSQQQQYRVILGVGINVFNAPLKIATSIKNHQPVDEILWKNFLEILKKQLMNLKNQNDEKLSSNERNQLLSALNRNPFYKNIQEVKRDGSLIFSHQSINWIDL